MTGLESLPLQVLELLCGGREQSPGTKAVDPHPSPFFSITIWAKLAEKGRGGCQLAGRFFLPCSKVSNYSHGYEADISFLQSSLGKSQSACGPFRF